MPSLMAAFQFLTLVPPLIRRPFKPRELGRSLNYYPLVGLVLGLILYGANLGLSRLLGEAPRSALTLILWVLLVGGFHLDGFLDTLDGIFGGFQPEDRLEIMRDERVGAYGLAGGILLLLLKFTLISSLPTASQALILVPVFSRWGMVFALVVYPYARKEGLGSWMKENAGWQQLLAASLIALLPAVYFFGLWGLGALLFSLVLTWLTAAFLLSRIPGLTGDNYGAINELLEVSLLLFFLGIS